MTPPRRLRLRVLDELTVADSRPDALRTKLGGRAPVSDASVGAVVHVRGRDAASPAVVLFADETEAHVWIGDGLVRRVAREALSTHEGETPRAQASIAESARTFATLTEGQRVTFLDATGKTQTGVLVEKHRFGALVDASGTVVGVGFRRVFPAAAALS